MKMRTMGMLAEIRGKTCLIGLGRPGIGIITDKIWLGTCHLGDGKFTHTQNCLNSSLSWLFALSILIALFFILTSTVT
jgi:hypothetical protein